MTRPGIKSPCPRSIDEHSPHLANGPVLNANNMKEKFENVDMDGILSFLREIKSYKKLNQ